MAKLTKAEAKAHAQACALLEKEVLTDDDKWFVLENWQESANHVNSIAGAFFTPPGLARDFAIEVCGRRIIDLCAGIGGLSWMAWKHSEFDRRMDCKDPNMEIVCVELNPAYVEVGKKILPEATWICGSVFELPEMGRFDCAISNPPFGATPRTGGKSPRYTGSAFEYHVIDIASAIADYGVFIIPQQSAPFRYSGQRHFREEKTEHYIRFSEQTGIELWAGCGIDCDFYRKDWHGVSVSVEVVTADFTKPESEAAARPVNGDLFSEAA